MLTSLEIGRRIAQARKDKGLSQAQVANRLTVSPQAVGKWERGESLPDVITLDRIALFLGVGLEYFSETTQQHRVDQVQRTTEAAMPQTDAAPSQHYDERAGASYDDEDVPRWDFSQGDWRDCDFSGLHNLADTLKEANIDNCKFVDSELRGLELRGSNVVGSSFQRADMTGAVFKSCNVARGSFESASLAKSLFRSSSISECSLDSCSLAKATFKNSSLTDCSLASADLTAAVFEGSSLIRCDIQDAVLVNTAFKVTQLAGITFSGNLSTCSFENCDLSKAEFRGAHLENTFFKGKGLKKARFIDCTVDRMTFAFMTSGKVNMSGITIVD